MTNFSALHSLQVPQAKAPAKLHAVGQVLRPLSLSLLIAMGVTFAVQAQTSVKARSADFIVAVVNSEPITNNEVQALKARLEKELPPGTKLPEGQSLDKQALDQLIIEKAQLQVARENGIRIEENEIELTLQNIARQNQLTKEQLFQRLGQEGLTLAAFREQVRTQLVINRLREREVENRSRISDADVEKEIQARQLNNQGSALAMDLNLAMILIPVPENSSPTEIAALQARAQQVSQRAKSGENFANLATSFSQAADKGANGGEMGLRSADRYPTLFVQSVATLKKGDVSDPIRSGAGFHILKVLEKKQSDMSGTTIVQTRARHILLRLGNDMTESAARNRLLSFKQRIQAGTDFAELARQFSQDGSAASGGDLGWAAPGQFVPEFEEVMAQLRPGQISEPLVSRFGVHLIQVMERRDAPVTLREQREIVRNQLREKKIEELYTTWLEELRGRAYIELRDPPQ
jgi:peptidyl-prolyl cis-trans isomerase SurA